MEILFLDSTSMIIIVTDLAWELVSQDCAPDYTATVYIAQILCQYLFPWLILCQSYLRLYALGKDLVEFLQP